MKYSDDILDKYLPLSSISEKLEIELKKARGDGSIEVTDAINKCYSFQITKVAPKGSLKMEDAGRWLITGGKEAFLSELKKVLANEPSGIEVAIYDNSRQKKLINKHRIITNPDEIQQISLAEKENKEFKKTSNQITLLEMKFNFEREKDKLERKIEDLTKENEQYKIDLEEAENEIDEIKENNENTLNGFEEDFKKLEELKINPPYVNTLSTILGQAASGLILKHPASLDFLNYSPSAKAELLKQLSADFGEVGEATQTKELNASFEQTNDKSLEGKSEDFKKMYNELDTFFKNISDEELKLVYSLIVILIKENKVDTEKYKKILSIMQDTEKTNKETEPVNDNIPFQTPLNT